MVRIITGKIDSKKTSRMLERYEHDHQGDGFISLKRMIKDKVHSYEAVRLKTKERLPFVVRDEFVYKEFLVSCQIGPYLFNQDTINAVTKAILEMIKNKVEPIYLDEIGVLEFEGKCFDHILKKMVASGLDLVISVREDLVKTLIEKYHIEDYELI